MAHLKRTVHPYILAGKPQQINNVRHSKLWPDSPFVAHADNGIAVQRGFIELMPSDSTAYDCSSTDYADFELVGIITGYEYELDAASKKLKHSSAKFDVISWNTVSVLNEIVVRGSNSSNCGCHYEFEVGKAYRVNGEYIGGRAFTYYCSGIGEIPTVKGS